MSGKDRFKESIRMRHAHAAIIPTGPAAEMDSPANNPETTSVNSVTEQNNNQENVIEKLNSNTVKEKGTVQGTVTMNPNTGPAAEMDGGASNSRTILVNSETDQNNNQEYVTEKLNSNSVKEKETVQGTVTMNQNTEAVPGIVSGLLISLNKQKKKTVEQTHTRDTYLIENDLLERLNAIAKRQPKGFKMRLVNHLLRHAVEEIERDEAKAEKREGKLDDKPNK